MTTLVADVGTIVADTPQSNTNTAVTALTEAVYINFRRCHSKDLEQALEGCHASDPEATLRGLPTENLKAHIRAAAASNRVGVVSLLLAKAHALISQDDQNTATLRAHYAAALASATQASCGDVVTWLIAPSQLQYLTDADLVNAAVLAHNACVEALRSRLFAARLAVLESLLHVCPAGHSACCTRSRRVPDGLHGHAKSKGQWLSAVANSEVWSIEQHTCYPPAFQAAAKALLLVASTGSDDLEAALPRLPKDVLLCVLRHAARPMHVWISC